MSQILQLAGMISQNLPLMSKEVLQYWITSPKDLKEFLKQLATSRLPITLAPTDDFLQIEDCWEVLEREGRGVCEEVVEMMKDPAFSLTTCDQELDLVNLTPADVGYRPPFGRGIEILEPLYYLAQKRGLELCPPDVAPRLRQVWNGVGGLHIAMKPIKGKTFYLWMDDQDGNVLQGYDQFEEVHEHEDFIFVKPRK